MEQENVMTLRISNELRDWLQKRAKKLHIAPSAFVRQILETIKDWEGIGD